MTEVLIRKKKRTETHREEGDVKMEAEIEMRQLQVKECQGLLATTRSWDSRG